MAFPLTHLLVADILLTRHSYDKTEASAFILGSLAPDAVHYRTTIPSDMGGIGATKKITHLCPISEERWGSVTDNTGWVAQVKAFLQSHPGPLYAGYATHALTDIYNNMTLWERFRTNHPKEAKKGYQSLYYQDLRNIDQRLFQELTPQVDRIWRLLAAAVPRDLPGLITADELRAIQENILYENYKNLEPNLSRDYSFVTYEESLAWMQDAADFVAGHMGVAS